MKLEACFSALLKIGLDIHLVMVKMIKQKN